MKRELFTVTLKPATQILVENPESITSLRVEIDSIGDGATAEIQSFRFDYDLVSHKEIQMYGKANVLVERVGGSYQDESGTLWFDERFFATEPIPVVQL